MLTYDIKIIVGISVQTLTIYWNFCAVRGKMGNIWKEILFLTSTYQDDS